MTTPEASNVGIRIGMDRRSAARLLLLAISLSTAAITIVLWKSQHTDEQSLVRSLQPMMDDIFERQRHYFSNNMAYSPGFQQLGLDPPSENGWHYTMAVAKGKEGPMMVIEAMKEGQSVAMTQQHSIFMSQELARVSIPEWKAEAPESRTGGPKRQGSSVGTLASDGGVDVDTSGAQPSASASEVPDRSQAAAALPSEQMTSAPMPATQSAASPQVSHSTSVPQPASALPMASAPQPSASIP